MLNAYYEVLDCPYVILNDVKGGYLQTKHLIENGHRNLLGFFKKDDQQGMNRMKGYLKAHRNNNLKVNEKNIVLYLTEDKDTKPKKMLNHILDNDQEITGIVCYNDQLALDLLDVLRERKLNIPEDISIVGFDDSFLVNVSEVKLSSIIHPKIKLGKKAANIIIGLIEENQSVVNKIVFEPEIVLRKSTSTFKTKDLNV